MREMKQEERGMRRMRCKEAERYDFISVCIGGQEVNNRQLVRYQLGGNTSLLVKHRFLDALMRGQFVACGRDHPLETYRQISKSAGA
jgi:hypothetical protein